MMDPRTQGTTPGSPAPGAGPGPRERGPRLIWIPASWALFIGLVVIAVVGFLGTVNGAAPGTTFASGERVTVALDPADGPVLYASGRPGQVSCDQSAGLTLTTPEGELTIELNGVTWELIANIEVPAPGDYQVACEGETAPTFGVGTRPGSAPWLMLLLPFLGFVAAVATTIVVLARRRSARQGH